MNTHDSQLIPTFEIPLLEHSAVAALEFLAGASDSVSKRQLMAHLEDKGFVVPRQKKSVTPQALRGQLDSILRKLEAWGFVDLVSRGKQMRIEITDRGIEGRKMLFHVLNPRKTLDVLT